MKQALLEFSPRPAVVHNVVLQAAHSHITQQLSEPKMSFSNTGAFKASFSP